MRLAERLSQRSLGGKVFFANSGAEANEAAIKLARKAQAGRRDRRRSGRLPRAHLRRAVGDAAGVQAGAVRAARSRLRGRRAEDVERSRAAVTTGPRRCCSSPYRARRASSPLPDELLAAARAACDQVGAALIFDEIQSGMGRTGTLWAYEQTAWCPTR